MSCLKGYQVDEGMVNILKDHPYLYIGLYRKQSVEFRVHVSRRCERIVTRSSE